MIRALLLTMIWLLWAAPGWGQGSALEAALEKSQWNEAVPLLQQLERDRGPGANLCYNLGLCYQRIQDLGRARAYYEGSLRRNPWNGNLHKNLALLKTQLREPEPEESWLQAASHCAPPALLAFCAIVFSWAACSLAWLYRTRPRERWLWSGLACALLAILSSSLWVLARVQPDRAAVVPETVQLMNGPGGEFTQSLNLHAGNLVEIVRQQGDWVEVDALGKVRAWIRRDQLQWVP